MNKPDWPGICRMVHHRLGLLRFEHSLEPSKRERLKDIFDEEAPTMKNLKLSDILFTKEDIMALDVGWDEALWERLQPAEEPAYHKRKTTDDLPISLLQHHQFPTTTGNVEFPIEQEQRATSEEPIIEGCARQEGQEYLDEAEHLPVEHDDSAMPSTRSRSQGRKRTHSVSQEDIANSSGDTAPALPDSRQQGEQGGGEAVATIEVSDSEPTVISSKRIKSNSGERLREQSNTPEPQAFPKTISTGNSGTLKAGPEGKEENASVEGNERDQKETDKNPVPVKKPWSYFEEYDKRPPSNIKQFGNPRPVAPARRSTSSEEHRSMAPPRGGFTPKNTLSRNSLDRRPNPEYKKPESRNGHGTSRQRDDQEEPIWRSQPDGQQRSNKRRKIESTTTSHNGSSKSPIDLETESTRSSRQMAPPASNPEYNQMKGPQSRVQEFHKVEDTVGFKKRKSNSGSQPSNGHSTGSRCLRTVGGQQVVRLDDPDDPVSDDDVEVTTARHTKHSASGSARKSTLEIQLTSSQGSGVTGYQGTANRRPARPAQKSLGNDDTPEGSSSKYFASTGQSQKQESKNSTCSHPAEAQRPSTNVARRLGQQKGSSGPINQSARSSNLPFDPDASLDELNSEVFDQHRETANKLLSQQKTAHAASAKVIGRNKQNQSVEVGVDYSSDDALANDKANIVPTTFITKGKASIVSREERYDAQFIFSEFDLWLIDEKYSPWTLIHNSVLKTLELFDGGNTLVWTLPTRKIEKIECHPESKIIMIHKARDQTTGKGIHLHIKLCDKDQSYDLRDSLKTSQSTIQILKKDIAYLNSVVENMLAKTVVYQEKALAAAKKRRAPMEDADDIKLMTVNSQRKSEARRLAPQASSTSLSGGHTGRQTTQDEAKERPRSKGLAAGMRTRSSVDRFENDGLRHSAELPEVESDSFYGKPASRRDNSNPLYGTRSSTRGQERELNHRQLRPRNPSPPPLRSWTRENPEWTRRWHNSIIYPAVGKGRARVDMGDIKKLDDGEFLNDNLIVFYLRYLQDQLERRHPERAKRIYFQNTFFYQKLAKSEKGTKSINYEAVKKWTSKEDILNKDYIIIPINEHTHWYVAIICNTPKLLPGAEATNSFQPQDPNDNLGGDRMDAEDNPRPSSAVEALPKQISNTSGSGDVDTVMKDMSLDDNGRKGPDGLRSSTNGLQAGEEIAESSSPLLANVVSDLLEPEPPKTSHTKKAKRKSGPPPRKHNPKEFRIITLDSLGSSHTVTCSNLKDYLVMEIKDKRNIDIERPGSIGTTAKGIPMQDNHYDCGLFLLCYVEMFLENPDEFIGGILQSDETPEYPMPTAVDMRKKIRNLLFKLQDEQHAEMERQAKLKGKGKKAGKIDDNSGSTSASKLSSREASKSTRASPEGQPQGESGDMMERPSYPGARPPQKEHTPEESNSRTEGYMIPASRQEQRGLIEQRVLPKSGSRKAEDIGSHSMNSVPELLNGAHRRAHFENADVSKPAETQRHQMVDLSAATQEVAKPSGLFGRIYSGTTKVLQGLLNQDKQATLDNSNRAFSATDTIEIGDSPQKQSPKTKLNSEFTELVDSSKTLSGNRGPNKERVEQLGGSRSRGQRNAQTNRHSLNEPNGRRFISPTPETSDHTHRTPAEHEITDLRTPSPITETAMGSGKTKARRETSPAARSSNGIFSANQRRNVKASSPEILQTPSPGAADRPSLRSGAGELGNFGDAEVGDSESEDNSIELVETDPRRRTTSNGAREVSVNDAEMLLPSTEAQDEVVFEDASPSLLLSSQASTSGTGPASRHLEGRKSAPSSPNLKYGGRRRSSSSGENRGTKRKGPRTGETDDWQEYGRADPVLRRDVSDQAIIGNHRPSGRHMRVP